MLDLFSNLSRGKTVVKWPFSGTTKILGGYFVNFYMLQIFSVTPNSKILTKAKFLSTSDLNKVHNPALITSCMVKDENISF